MTTILTTTGISLYKNTSGKYPSPSDDQLRHFLRTDPASASAEANSLLQIATATDHLVFLCTETPTAKRCAELLKEYFQHKGFQHVKVVSLQFQEQEEHIETQGLRNLVNTLISQIEDALRKQREVIINATAGFKAQIVYSTMIGMIYGVPVKYMYETFKKIVTFTPIALDWDTSLFLAYNWFFEWLDEEPRPQREVEERLKALSDRDQIRSMLMLPDENEDIFLSPMGNVLRQRFIHETEEAELVNWPPEVAIGNVDEKIAFSLLKSKHHPIKDILPTCHKLAEIPFIRQVIGGHFENTALSRIKRHDADGTIYLLWADDEKAQNIIIQTTSQGKPQTLKVVNKIREVLEI